MILPVHERLRERLLATLQHLYQVPPDALPQLPIEYPPKRELGDLATPVAFELARRLRKAPRVIAQELAAALGPLDGIARVEAAPNGYLNIYLDRVAFVEKVMPLGSDPRTGTGFRPQKAIVEHTAINPNKAAHIGHIRNSALGDTLVRVQRFRGVPVEVQNYIDDTGVQVADVVVGFRELEGKTLEDIRAIADSTRFDYYCWDLYARVTQWYDEDKERLKIRAATLHDIEHGGTATSDIAAFIAERIVRCHLKTMARLNVDYDLLTWEGHILRLQFWARAFEILKEKGAVYLQTEGKLAGCWVMKIEEDEPAPEGTGDSAASAEGSGEPRRSAHEADAQRRGSGIGESEESDREKVIVRSNGTVTYVGKDIAYQFWKLGLLGRDFYYCRFGTRINGDVLWSTSQTPGDASHPAFGRADATYNVIDVRQSYLQKLLKQALRTLGYAEQAERATHFSYEMVALSNAAARALGYFAPDAPDDKRGFVDVSGRKGQGVKADDLLDTLIARAETEVARRNPELSTAEHRRIADMIAVAAVRYFMVKYSRTKIIAFDIDEALAFEGESGPYLQYAVVRAQNIFAKLRDRDQVDEAAVFATLGEIDAAELTGEGGSHDLWALILEASRLDEIVEQVVRTLEFSVLAKYAFGLAQMFNGFYHQYPILNEEQVAARLWRAAGVAYVRAQLTRALDLMGIAVPPENVMAIIGITPSNRLTDYVESIRRAGGDPRVLSMDASPTLDGLDGVLFTGGGDIDPAHYGDTRHPKTNEPDTARDAFELALAKLALASDAPLLAVCRGLQVVNVAAGGTLTQDIPAQVNQALGHQVDSPPFAIAHEVWVTPGSVLAHVMQEELVDGEVLQVNSRHHQAVDKTAGGFTVSATAPDGVIEAIERPASRFCLAVQWHPENFWRTGEFRSLFEEFVKAAETR